MKTEFTLRKQKMSDKSKNDTKGLFFILFFLLVSFENLPHPYMKLAPLFDPLQTISIPPTIKLPHEAWRPPTLWHFKSLPLPLSGSLLRRVFNDLRMTRSWNNLHKVLSSWKTGKLNNYKVFESEQLKLLNFRGPFWCGSTYNVLSND